jgi:hypothetical protein
MDAEKDLELGYSEVKGLGVWGRKQTIKKEDPAGTVPFPCSISHAPWHGEAVCSVGTEVLPFFPPPVLSAAFPHVSSHWH